MAYKLSARSARRLCKAFKDNAGFVEPLGTIAGPAHRAPVIYTVSTD